MKGTSDMSDTSDIAWRICLFLFGCMGARFGLTYLAWRLPTEYLPIFGAFALLLAIGFGTIYVMGWRKTGAEVFGDRIWWNDLRPLHAALWFTFAILAFARHRDAWILLLADTIIGLSAFTYYHMFVRN